MSITSNVFPDSSASGGNKLQPWVAGQSYPSTQGVARATRGTYFDLNGVLQNAAPNELRINHNQTSPFASLGNLIEGNATNWVRNPIMSGANVGTNTMPTNWVFPNLQGCTRTVVATGTDQGIPYIDVRFSSGTATAGSIWAVIDSSIIPGFSLLNTVWSFSTYCKLQAGSLSSVTVTYGWELWDLAGANWKNGVAGTFVPTTAALATQRFTFTNQTLTPSSGLTLADNGSLRVMFYITVPAGAVDFTLRIGAPQAEQGSAVTSVILPVGSIPASGAGTPRTADLALIPRRVSNGGNAYQLITPGTSAASGGPTTTISDITDGTAHWKYLGVVNYTNLQSWVDGIPSTLADNYIGRIWNTGPISSGDHWINNQSATRTPGSYTMTLTAAPGDSFCDTLAGQATPLAYNVNNGVSLTCTIPSISVDFLVWLDNNVIIDGLQFQNTHSNDSSTLSSIGANSVYQNCLFDGYTQGGGVNLIQLCGGTIANCILIDRNSGTIGASAVNAWDVTIDPSSDVIHIINSAFVVTTPNTSVQAISHNSTVAPIYRNCIFLGYQTSPFGSLAGVYASPLVDHCLLSNASMPANATNNGSNLFGLTAANQFLTAYTDLRLKSGANAIDVGVNDTVDIPTSTDITKTTVRPTGKWDIGPWEYYNPLSCTATSSISLQGSGTASTPFRLIGVNSIGLQAVAQVGLYALSSIPIAVDPAATNLQLALDPPVMSFTGFTSPSKTSSSVVLNWSLALTAGTTLYLDVPAALVPVAAIQTIFSLRSIVQLAQYNQAVSTGGETLIAIGQIQQANGWSSSTNHIDVAAGGAAAMGPLFAETAFTGVLSVSSPSQDSYDITLLWNPPTGLVLFDNLVLTAVAGQGTLIHTNFAYPFVMRAAGSMKQGNAWSGAGSFAALTGVSNTFQSDITSVVQSLGSLSASAIVAGPNAAAGQASLLITADGTATVGGASTRQNILNFAVQAVVTATPSCIATVNADLRAKGQITQATNASATVTQLITVVSQTGQHTTTTGLGEIADLAATGTITNSCSLRMSFMQLQAIVTIAPINYVHGSEILCNLFVYQTLPYPLAAEDGFLLKADAGSNPSLRGDVSFVHLTQSDAFTALGQLDLTTIIVADQSPANNLSTISDVSFGAAIAVEQSTRANTEATWVLSGTGTLNASFIGLGSVLSFDVYQTPRQILLTDSDDLVLMVDPGALNLALKTDVAQLHLTQQDQWSTTSTLNLSAGATAYTSQILYPTAQSVILQPVGQLSQGTTASSHQAIGISGSGIVSFETAFVVSGTLLTLRAIAQMSSATSVSAIISQNLAATGALNQFTTATATGQLDLTEIVTARSEYWFAHALGQQDIVASGMLTMAGLVQSRGSVTYTTSASLSSNTNASGQAIFSVAVHGATTLFDSTTVVGQQDFAAAGTAGAFDVAQAQANQDLSANAAVTLTYFDFASGTASQNLTAAATAIVASPVRGVGSANAVNFWSVGTATYTNLIENQVKALGSSNAIELSGLGFVIHSPTQTNSAQGVGSANTVNFFATGRVAPYAPFIGSATCFSLEAQATLFQPVVVGLGNISFTAASSLGRSISSTAVAAITTDAAGIAIQGAPVTVTADISVSTTAEMASSTRATGLASIFFSVTGAVEINGSVVTGTVPIEIVFVSAQLGQTAKAVTGESVPMFMRMESVSGRLWTTPLNYVEGEQMIYWAD